MLYLRTGGNGTFKTALTLKDVRALQLETGRPVCFNLRPADHPEKPNTPYSNLYPKTIEEFGWKGIHFEEWPQQTPGTIFLIDECHYDLPQRAASQKPPAHIAQLTEHRSRGFDFFLLTQHPGNIDSFVRKLVQAPGWHQHLKRIGGAAPMVNQLQWDAVNLQCEQAGSGKTADTKTRTAPTEVYSWYDSATLHTGKVRIPFKLFVLLACVVLVPLLLWFGVSSIGKSGKKTDPVSDKAGLNMVQGKPEGAVKPKTVAEYVDNYRPRLAGLRHTAPAYDELTKPKRVPVPAACVQMADRCSCYTQDATSYATTKEICAQIVKTGLWLDFDPEGQQGMAKPQNAPTGPASTAAAPAGGGAPGAGGPVVIDGTRKVGDKPAAAVATGGDVQAQPRVPKSSPWSFQTTGG